MQYLNPPPGKVFLGSFGFPEDFFGNLNTVKIGQLDHWQHYPKITSVLEGQKSLMKIDYIILGQLNRLIPLETTVFFNLVRFLLSIFFLLLCYRLINLIFKEKVSRLTALVLAFFSTAFSGQKLLLDLWTPLGVFQRAAYYPHYLIGFCLLLLIIPILAECLDKNNWSRLILASLLGLIAALVHPPVIICLYLSFPFYLSALVWQKKSWPELKQKTIILVIFTLISSLSLFYFRSLSHAYPWNIIPKWELFYSLNKNISFINLILGIGPTAFLALIGAFLALRSKGEILLLLFPWSFTYLIGFYWLYQFISANSVRFLQTPFFIFLGILTVFPLQKVAQKIKVSPLVLGLLLLTLGLRTLHKSLLVNLDNFSTSFAYINSPIEVKAGLNWLAQNTTEKDIVLSDQDNGMLIVALAGNMPYLTHWTDCLDVFPQLENNIIHFYCQKWSVQQAKEFLQKEQISWVFYSDEEKNLCSQQNLDYSFLTPIFKNSRLTIFKTNIEKNQI